jgi:hypothetical protein
VHVEIMYALVPLRTLEEDFEELNIFDNCSVLLLQLDYDYRVSVLGLKPSGGLIGTAEGLRVAIDLTADLINYRTTVTRFDVLDAK